MQVRVHGIVFDDADAADKFGNDDGGGEPAPQPAPGTLHERDGASSIVTTGEVLADSVADCRRDDVMATTSAGGAWVDLTAGADPMPADPPSAYASVSAASSVRLVLGWDGVCAK